MQSAFGVDHGISKAAPARLMRLTNPKKIRAWEIRTHKKGILRAPTRNGSTEMQSGNSKGTYWRKAHGITVTRTPERVVAHVAGGELRRGRIAGHLAGAGAGAAGGVGGVKGWQAHQKKAAAKVKKSYVPGVGYKALSSLGRVRRGQVREGVEYASRVRANAGSRFKQGNLGGPQGKGAKGRKLWEGQRTPMNRQIKVSSRPTAVSRDNPGIAGYAMANGRGGGKVKVFNSAHATPEDAAITRAHEIAHVTPKRNIPRLHERTNNPRVSGREEGRADFIAHGGKSPGAYHDDSPEFQRGYREVQHKMHLARQGKQRPRLKQL